MKHLIPFSTGDRGNQRGRDAQFRLYTLPGDLRPFYGGDVLLLLPPTTAVPGDLVLVEMFAGGLAVEQFDFERLDSVIGVIAGHVRIIKKGLR